MMKLHVNVTQEDIDKGLPKVSDRCPIALAVRNAGVLLDTEIVVYSRVLQVDGYMGVLPIEAENFILVYDAGCSVEPFEFDVIVR